MYLRDGITALSHDARHETNRPGAACSGPELPAQEAPTAHREANRDAGPAHHGNVESGSGRSQVSRRWGKLGHAMPVHDRDEWLASRRAQRSAEAAQRNAADPISPYEDAVSSLLDTREQLVACLPCSASRSFGRVYGVSKPRVLFSSLRVVVAVTNRRFLVLARRPGTRSGQPQGPVHQTGGQAGAVVVHSNRKLLWSGKLYLLDEGPRATAEVPGYRTRRWRGGDDSVDWFAMKLRGEVVKFTYPSGPKHEDRGAAIVRALGYPVTTHDG
jgi:hypothetical protein